MQISDSSAVVVGGTGGMGEATVRRVHGGPAAGGRQLEGHWGPQTLHPKRMGQADEYAQLALAIAANDYLNGEVIRLDGGFRFPPK